MWVGVELRLRRGVLGREGKGKMYEMGVLNFLFPRGRVWVGGRSFSL